MYRRTLMCILCALLLLGPLTAAGDDTATPSPAPTAVPGPTLTLKGGETLTVDAAFTFADPGATAKDAKGKNLTKRITVEGTVTPYLVGEYVLTYSVTDDYGNRAEAQRTVTVVPVQLPETVEPTEKTIYLTFDDGPCGYTAMLLDILQKHDVKATFFVVGNRRQSEYIKRAFEEGHSIGVHSYTHVYKEIYASEAAFFHDFLATQEVIKAQTGQYTTLFRFPGGSNNTASYQCKGLMTRLTKIMEDMGYRYFDWTAQIGDGNNNGQSISRYYGLLVSKVQAAKGNYTVMLQHDLNYNSVRAVDFFIPWALENGYTFLPLDMTSPVVHNQVAN